jgi:hypothetical protein
MWLPKASVDPKLVRKYWAERGAATRVRSSNFLLQISYDDTSILSSGPRNALSIQPIKDRHQKTTKVPEIANTCVFSLIL